ncbi:MAG: creatininase family protein [Bacteroidia bacterium]|nr:creatininase family protein [Bacteroidia bacterium]
MKRLIHFILSLLSCIIVSAQQANENQLPYKMEELSSPQFVTALEKSGGVCVIPLGIIEKHGPHLPLGTDLFEAREVAFIAAQKEYAIVFPPYFAGQIFEARHQPGTIAYSSDLMWKMLEETCRELSRNGVKKIIILNGHGGNNNFLRFFCQSQLSGSRDYVVLLFQPAPDQTTQAKINSLKKTTQDGHAGEEETSMMYVIRPDLVHPEATKTQSGEDQARLKQLPYAFTGIWWYAKFPNHYAGDGSRYSKELGKLLIRSDASQLAELIRYLKSDNSINALQEEFSKRAQNPVLQ